MMRKRFVSGLTPLCLRIRVNDARFRVDCSWIAHGQRMRRNILHQHGASAHEGTLSNLGAGTDEGLGSYPHLIFHHNRLRLKIEGFALPVMGTGTEKGPLGNADVRAKRNGGQAKDENFFAQPDMASRDEAPGEGDVHARTNHDVCTQPGAEEAKQCNPKGRWPREGVEKEEALAEDPEALFDASGSTVKI